MKTLRSALAFALLLHAPLAAQTVSEGDPVPGGGRVERVLKIAAGNAGRWLVEVETDAPDPASDRVLLGPDGVVLAEGAPVASPPGATVRSVLQAATNETGRVAALLQLTLRPFPLAIGWGLYVDGRQVLGDGILPRDPALPTGTTYLAAYAFRLNARGQVLAVVGMDDPTRPYGFERGLVLLDLDAAGRVLAERVLVRSGDPLPGTGDALAYIPLRADAIALDDVGRTAYLGSTFRFESALVLDGRAVVRDGDLGPVPGTVWASVASGSVALDDRGGWALHAPLDGAGLGGKRALVRDGELIAFEGEVLPDLAPRALASLALGPVHLTDAGNVLWHARTDGPGATDGVLLVDRTPVVREGVTAVAGRTVAELRAVKDGYAIEPDGRSLRFWAELEDGTEVADALGLGTLAWSALRNLAPNPICLLTSSAPVLGGTWTVEVDPSRIAGTRHVVLLAHAAPASAPRLRAGTLLLDLASPELGRAVRPTSGGIETFQLPIPPDPALADLPYHAQALLLGFPVRALCNAVDARLGTAF